ncbi:MAG: hypothetical protein ACFCD0_29665 [Gemmataceae bacterium]
MRKVSCFIFLVALGILLSGCQRKDYSYYALKALERLRKINYDATNYKSSKGDVTPFKTTLDEEYAHLSELRDNMEAELPEDENARIRMQDKYKVTFDSICKNLKQQEDRFRSFEKAGDVPATIAKIRKLFDPSLNR